MSSSQKSQAKIGFLTASSLVIANMIGTGVFTSLGFQVAEIKSIFPLLMLWFVGGIIALCGALTYGELGAAFPRSGGEYNLLYRIYHPSLGFLAGWVSTTVGFAAPTALAAIALGKYTSSVFPGVWIDHLAATTVVIFSVVHAYSIRLGSFFQNFFTILKVILILIFILAAFTIESSTSISVLPQPGDFFKLMSPAFAVSLVYVSYAYTGWNAAIYIVSEIKDPVKNLPKSLFLGSLLVLILYVLLNFVFLYTVPLEVLSGQVEIGFLSGTRIFGEAGGQIMALVIALLLVSTVSAMVFIGPRIIQVMGEDFPALHMLSRKSHRGIPVNAIIFQLGVTLIFIYSSTFEQVLIYAAFALILITTLAVGGVFFYRITQPDLPRPIKTWGYPYTPLLYVITNLWIMGFLMIDKTFESLVGLGIVTLGLLVYFLSERGGFGKNKSAP